VIPFGDDIHKHRSVYVFDIGPFSHQAIEMTNSYTDSWKIQQHYKPKKKKFEIRHY